jgi:hypothetical protein
MGAPWLAGRAIIIGVGQIHNREISPVLGRSNIGARTATTDFLIGVCIWFSSHMWLDTTILHSMQRPIMRCTPAMKRAWHKHAMPSMGAGWAARATLRPCTVAAAASPASAGSASTSRQERSEGTPIEGVTVGGLALLQQEFDVAGRRLRVVCPRDPDEVLDHYISTGADGDPYWTRVWASAIALAAELLRRPQLVKGLRVADLGGARGRRGYSLTFISQFSCLPAPAFLQGGLLLIAVLKSIR